MTDTTATATAVSPAIETTETTPAGKTTRPKSRMRAEAEARGTNVRDDRGTRHGGSTAIPDTASATASPESPAKKLGKPKSSALRGGLEVDAPTPRKTKPAAKPAKKPAAVTPVMPVKTAKTAKAIPVKSPKTAGEPAAKMKTDRSMKSDVPVAERRLALLRALRSAGATDASTARSISSLAADLGYTSYDVYCLGYHKYPLATGGFVKSIKLDGAKELSLYLTKKGQTEDPAK